MLPDENSKKFVAVLNKKVETGKLMNALGHMAAGLAGGFGKGEEMNFLQYIDKDGGVHPNIYQPHRLNLCKTNSEKKI